MVYRPPQLSNLHGVYEDVVDKSTALSPLHSLRTCNDSANGYLCLRIDGYRGKRVYSLPKIPNLILSLVSQQSQGDFQSNYNSRFNQPQGQSSQRRYSNAVASVSTSGQRSVWWFFCNGLDILTKCNTFLALSPDDKHNFIRSKRLCFGCLRHGHSNRDCQRRMR